MSTDLRTRRKPRRAAVDDVLERALRRAMADEPDAAVRAWVRALIHGDRPPARSDAARTKASEAASTKLASMGC